jgi:hypothetical protein
MSLNGDKLLLLRRVDKEEGGRDNSEVLRRVNVLVSRPNQMREYSLEIKGTGNRFYTDETSVVSSSGSAS